MSRFLRNFEGSKLRQFLIKKECTYFSRHVKTSLIKYRSLILNPGFIFLPYVKCFIFKIQCSLTGSPPPDTHEPFQLLLPADPSGPPPSEPSFNPGPPHPPTPLVDEAPPGSPGPVPPPLDSMSITHDEFAKMGEHLNPELLSVIEKNNHKISALWNEVRDVQSRLGNIESVVQVVEKAVQRIESKLGEYADCFPTVYSDLHYIVCLAIDEEYSTKICENW